MTMYYVATRASYVLVDADSEDDARTLGLTALTDLQAEECRRRAGDVRIDIHTVREASAEEVELWRWHHDRLAKETDE